MVVNRDYRTVEVTIILNCISPKGVVSRRTEFKTTKFYFLSFFFFFFLKQEVYGIPFS